MSPYTTGQFKKENSLYKQYLCDLPCFINYLGLALVSFLLLKLRISALVNGFPFLPSCKGAGGMSCRTAEGMMTCRIERVKTGYGAHHNLGVQL